MIIFVISAIVVVIGAMLYMFSQKPAVGTTKTVEKKEAAVQLSTDVPNFFEGKYVAFTYGQGYLEKSHEISEDGSGVILESAYFSNPSGVSKKIALTVRNFPSGNLEDVPDFKMRQLKSDSYRQVDFSEGEITGKAFVPADDGPFEKTFFIKHGYFLAIIAFTAPAIGNQELENEADGVAKSVLWLK